MRRSILSVIGCSIVLLILATATSSSSRALPNGVDPGQVVVVNTPQEAIPVSIEEPLIVHDNKAKKRFQFSDSGSWDESTGLFYLELTRVPEGQVLVIEHITMYANIGFAEELHWPRLVFSGPGLLVRHYLDFKRTTPDLAYSMTGSQPFLGRWHGSQLTLLHGTGTVSFQCNRANTPFVDGAAGVSISGYFMETE